VPRADTAALTGRGARAARFFHQMTMPVTVSTLTSTPSTARKIRHGRPNTWPMCSAPIQLLKVLPLRSPCGS